MSTIAAPAGPLLGRRALQGRGWLSYGVAVLLPLLTLLVRLAFWDVLPGFPYVAFIPSVLIASVLGGVGPGIVAAVLSAELAVLFLSPPGGLLPVGYQGWVGLAFHSLVSAIIVAQTHLADRATSRMREALTAHADEREYAYRARIEAADAEAARSRTERDLEQLTDSLPVLIAHVGRDLKYRFVNHAYEQWFSTSRAEVIGRPVEQVLGAQAFAGVKPRLDAALSGERLSFEQMMPYQHREHRTVRADYVPQTNAKGEVEGIFALVQDVTDAKKQAEQLATSERRMRAVLESVSDGFYAADAEWRITLFNRAAERHFERSRDDVVGKTVWEAFPTLVGSEFDRQLRRVMENGVPVTFESSSIIRPGHFVETRAAPKEGGGIAVSFSDVTERKLAERHRELLINELNHRVKNTLAVVKSIATQSFKDPQVPQAARDAFDGRIMALAAAHDLLTQQNWDSAPLRQVAEHTLRVFGQPHRFQLGGPEVALGPKAAVSLALVLHELGTNACKYGALSNPSGTVRLTWSVEEAAQTFRLEWRETGGPVVDPPGRRGFGSRLIERGLAAELGGEVSLGFEPTGVVCTIRAPVANLEAR